MTTTTRRVWDGEVPPIAERAIAVAPHPDDEVLGMAGLLLHLQARGVPVGIVAVTDGEASHAASALIRPDELRRVRAEERTAALAALGLTADIVRLEMPDGAVARDEGGLADALADLVDEMTVLVSPWRHDGHPDHEATAAAARRACADRGATLWEVPIWAKVAAVGQGERPPGRSALVLDRRTHQRKRAAAACFRSQLVGLSDDPIDGPVVHPHELEVMLDGREELLWT